VRTCDCIIRKRYVSDENVNRIKYTLRNEFSRRRCRRTTSW